MARKKQYELIRSARRTLSVEVRVDGMVIVRAPKKCPQSEIDRFLKERQDWIREKLLLMEARQRDAEKVQPLSEEEQKLSKETAREALEQKLRYYAPKMGVTYGRISVKDQKTRWGSCSSEGNLNFNWRLIMAPPGVMDYVVVHELAHRKEMNHSRNFWKVVEEIMPDYQKYRKWLKENGNILHRY